ncbi:MAG: DNA polymerase III subunit delta', partial [Pseudomonadota bacterium]|nr:DNA polymerase III subunit delta' [Pseudomonadota bacterium]
MSALLDSAHLTSRTNPDLFGHREAVRELVTALESGRMPHAWILHGPPGIGKATLAFRLARHVLAGTKTSDLSLPSDHPVFSQVGSGGHPDLIVVEHNSSIDPAHLESDSAERQKPRKTIPVKEVRQIRQFFSMTAGMTGGARVAIVNDAHLLNREGQNALLKPLEEPPTGGLILLVAPSLTQLLPTVRSRCRKLAMAPLSPVDTADLIRCQRQQIGAEDIEALVALSEGRPGRALQLADSGALEDIASFMELARGFPRLDWPAVHAFAGKLAGRGREAAQAATLDFIVQFLGTLVRR